jgi:hypothetical protein
MYIFCFFSSILHNKEIKFEDNSTKEEELHEFVLKMTLYPNGEGRWYLEYHVLNNPQGVTIP